jgi:hypothetical protein
MKRTAAVLLTLFSPLTVLSQSTTGNLEGWVLDTTGVAITGAGIAVTSPDLQGIRGISTDERGFFRLLALPSGKYTVKIRHVSYQPATFENVQIWLGKTTTLPAVRLQQTSVEMAEVIVSGERPLLDPTSTTSGANLPIEKFDVLPLDRNYRSIASILPNANQSYYGDGVNIAGATGVENRYFINGNDVTDEFNGVGGTNLPYNFIREIEVKTGGFEPEFKSSLGGVINVITYSGGNDFSGQVFGFTTNSTFAGEQRLAPSQAPKGSFAQYDFGLAVGGPIVRDQLWFFCAYDPSYRNEDVRIPGLGYYPDQIKTQTFAGKLTWRATDAFDMTATFLGDPSTRKAVNAGFWNHHLGLGAGNADPFLEDITTGGYNVQIEAKHVASQSLLLQGSVSWTTSDRKYMPSTAQGAGQPYFYDGVTGIASGGTGERVDIRTTILGAKFSGTALFNDHVVKVGGEFREVLLDNINTYSRILKNSDTDYAVLDINQSGKIRNHVPSIYVQDSWSVSNSLRVTGGLRWDALFLIASNGNLATRVLPPIQPRVGVVFIPGSDESHKIFASFGRYAEDLMLYGSTLYQIDSSYQSQTNFNHDPRLNPAGGVSQWNPWTTLPPGVQDLKGQYYDEFTLGYEQLLAKDLKITLKGTYRTLKEAIDDAEEPPGSGQFIYGNPGEGQLSDYPHPRRDYAALEVSFEKSWGSSFSLLASYILSRNYGNYLGLYYQEFGAAIPNAGPQFDYLDLLNNHATGLLPNDRTHILKLNGAYRFDFGLTCAASFLWETGTPLSEYVATRGGGWNWVLNLVPRGSAGRLPSLWDLNLRFAYSPSFLNDAGLRPRLILDILHLGSQRQVVSQDELHYLDVDANGNPLDPSATYGLPQMFQPPMSVRLGMEVNF